MTDAIKKQERVFKKLFILLSATLALVFITAILPPCDSKPKRESEFTVKINPAKGVCDAKYNTQSSGCIFRNYLFTDRLFG